MRLSIIFLALIALQAVCLIGQICRTIRNDKIIRHALEERSQAEK